MCTDEGLRTHLIDWCNVNTPGSGSKVLVMDLTKDNNSTISDENSVQSIPRQEISTVQTILVAPTTVAEDRNVTVEDTLEYCFCRKTYAQDKAAMIQCCGNPCLAMSSTNSWYHKKCLKERKIVVPKDDSSDWYCPPCSVHRQFFPPIVAPEAAPLAQMTSSRSTRSKK